MTFDDILSVLAQFNLVAWLIATIVSLLVLLYTRTKAWLVVMIGSLFVILRQGWKFVPGYKDGQASELLFNAYMMRYVFGAIGATILCVGLTMLIINYYVVRSRLDEEF